MVRTPSTSSPADTAAWIREHEFENPPAEDGVGRPAHHRVGHLLIVEHRAATARASHDVDSVARAGVEIHIVDRLHSTEAQTGRSETVQTHRTRNLAPRAGVEQLQVATHVLRTRCRCIDDQLEPFTFIDGGVHGGTPPCVRH